MQASGTEWWRRTCSYCTTKMEWVGLAVPRPRPAGAQDLGLTDDVRCWQCPKCQATALPNRTCSRCGDPIVSILPKDAATVPRHIPAALNVRWHREEGNEDRCLRDIACACCHRPIGDVTKLASTERRWESSDGDTLEKSYLHVACVNTMAEHDADEELRASYEAEIRSHERKFRPFLDYFDGRSVPAKILTALFSTLWVFPMLWVIPSYLKGLYHRARAQSLRAKRDAAVLSRKVKRAA